ncbi:Yip1 domain-containing protein [Amphibacillus marinus]|uniref:Yip1 domain-containing protein n=1 Tax=Amphibacillus marinus TaxID=872970 RepID=A0A1H8IR24_9BACI|nr:Yip1 family protein [Amphibacillus marinus]SEN70821.1 Yip1 domain-containing protein [Amphibacillus marinus]
MRSYLAELKYSLHVVVRPFDGFWDLQREQRGSLRAALTIVLLTIATYIFRRQYTGFLFNYNQITRLNIVLEVISVLLPFLLWCVANWCLTTLADGEGTFIEIFNATAYALTPIVLINLPLIPISYLITSEEGAFYYFFLTISLIWTVCLIILSTMITHQYSMKKTFLTITGILIGMAVMVFIGLLFTSVIQQIFGFFYVIYREIVFRF